MKKLIEFIKDTIYDFSHIMWILIIIVAVGAVVGFQSVTLFSRDYTTDVAKEAPVKEESTVAKVAEEVPKTVQVTIPEGANYVDISKILIDAGVITDEEDFVKKIQDQGLEEAIIPGVYEIQLGAEPEVVLEAITTE